ncbi:hypothetical protein B0H10DRAFT_2428472 [Mycena sp. CBHHK59/15]|nr:hypothetical protein B0H10DRAFT_2428472 [Mycena sp. CBHHK59/15]
MESKKGRGRQTKLRPEQTSYMEGLYDKFDSSRRRDKLQKFWTNMESGWFRRWPEEEVLEIQLLPPDPANPDAEPTMADDDMRLLGESVKARKAQLHARFNNRSQKLKKAQGGSTSQAGSLAAKLFSSLRKKKRRYQEVEIYQKRHKAEIDRRVDAAMAIYDRGIADKKDDASTDSDSSSSDSSSSDSSSSSGSGSGGDAGGSKSQKVGRFKAGEMSGAKSAGKSRGKNGSVAASGKLRAAKAFEARRRIGLEMWEAADEEETAAVRKIYQAQEAVGTVKQTLVDTESADKTPEELQYGIDQIEGIIAEFHAGLERMTGWIGLTLLGGPMPEEAGKVVTMSYFSGESPAGLSLAQSIAEWDSVVITGTGQWLRRCFPHDVRKARAIEKATPAKATALPDEVSPDSTRGPPPTEPAATASAKGKAKKSPPLKPKQTTKQLAAAANKARKAAAAAAKAADEGDVQDDGIAPDDFAAGADFDRSSLEVPHWVIDPSLLPDQAPIPGPETPLPPRPRPRPAYNGAPTAGEPSFPVTAATPETLLAGYPPFVYDDTPARYPLHHNFAWTPDNARAPSTPASALRKSPAADARTPSLHLQNPGYDDDICLPALHAGLPPAQDHRDGNPDAHPRYHRPLLPLPLLFILDNEHTRRHLQNPGCDDDLCLPPLHASLPPAQDHGGCSPDAHLLHLPAILDDQDAHREQQNPGHDKYAHLRALAAHAGLLKTMANPTPTSAHITARTPPSTTGGSTPALGPPTSITALRAAAAAPSLFGSAPRFSAFGMRMPDTVPVRHRSPIRPAPPVGTATLAPVALTSTSFPESRPASAPPLAPRGRGGARGGGRRARGAGRGGRGRGGSAAIVFRQTYDDSGNVVPLPLDEPPAVSRADVRAVRAREKAMQDKYNALANAPRAKNPLSNPDGSHDLFVTQGTRTQRIRKAAPSREMPVPIVVKTRADKAAAEADAALLKQLTSKQKGKRRAANDENEGPRKKARR